MPPLMYSPWMKVCGKGKDTNNKKVCVVTKDGRLENASADPSDTGRGLQIRFPVDDPNVFTAPWSATVTYLRNIDPWVENVCAENQHNYGVAPDPKLPVADRPDF